MEAQKTLKGMTVEELKVMGYDLDRQREFHETKFNQLREHAVAIYQEILSRNKPTPAPAPEAALDEAPQAS